jgi:hypothetical protein
MVANFMLMKYVFLFSFLVLVFSCSKEEEEPEPIVVSFTQSEFSFDESEGLGYIEAQLSRPAPHNFAAIFRVEQRVGTSSAIIYTTASGSGIVDGEITLSFEDGATTGKFMFSFQDDNLQEDDQLLYIKLVSPQSPLFQGFFGNATIDAAHDKTILRIVSNEKRPKGNVTMKVNGVGRSAVNIETFKGSFYRYMDCDMYQMNFIFDECSPNFCETKFYFTFQSLPAPGTVLNFNTAPMSGFNATQVVTTYVKWGHESCYPSSGSMSIIEHDPVAKKVKLSFSGTFWSDDGHVKRTYEITDGIVDLSLYDFSVCLN